MTLAFSAIVLAALTLPGFITWYAYRIEDRSFVGVHSRPPLDQVLCAAAVSLIMHVPWLVASQLLSPWTGARVDLNRVIELLAGTCESEQVRSISTHPIAIAAYFVSIYVCSGLFGYCLRLAVRRHGWDDVLPVLRFSHWYYLFGGDRHRHVAAGPTHAGVYVAAAMEIGGENYLYRGFLWDFAVDREGNLAHIVLRGASRRRLSDDREKGKTHTYGEDSRYYPIFGDRLVLSYANAKNLQLTYVALREKKRSSGNATSS